MSDTKEIGTAKVIWKGRSDRLDCNVLVAMVDAEHKEEDAFIHFAVLLSTTKANTTETVDLGHLDVSMWAREVKPAIKTGAFLEAIEDSFLAMEQDLKDGAIGS